MYYAHSRNAQGKRHELVTHLRAVADLAAGFAEPIDGAACARYLGLWHDVGKFSQRFQEYLAACETNPQKAHQKVDHKTAGSIIAKMHTGTLAMLVQAHHGGLRTPNGFKDWLALRQDEPYVREALARARAALPDLEPQAKPSLPSYVEGDQLDAEFYLRFLFSALVDADALDTERHFAHAVASNRGSSVTVEELWERFATYMRGKTGIQGDALGRARHHIYQDCQRAADLPPGLFRLAVPTGGGKTLAGMGFALRHMLRHGLQRVIVAVPFISITEQTAMVYRDVFERDPIDQTPVVLEHHTGAREVSDEDGSADQYAVWQRLASENWDAPIIVTTTVQLFESLFASGTSRCRKLHNLANSVIILDEVQSLPPKLLSPILDALGQLTAHCHTTVVLSTATQPAFEAISQFANVKAHDLIPDATPWFSTLQRVTFEWHIGSALSWTEVANIMRAQSQALVIVNTKKDALALLESLDDPDALHLSTLLCGSHRRAVINEIRARLASNQPCHVVSTQCIEAGVDVDFPLVLRALGPLDSIIQAAGRCNREGKLNKADARVIVFRTEEDRVPPGPYRTATEVTTALLGQDGCDLHDPTLSRAYFAKLFQTIDLDARRVQELRKSLLYPDVAHAFQMIEEDTESVVITTYGTDTERGEVQRMISRLRSGAPEVRTLFRELQPYLVAIRHRDALRYQREGLIMPITTGLGEWIGSYDPVHGLHGVALELGQLIA
jgi:CRISPR-associated endonuclease/helicase Cas3